MNQYGIDINNLDKYIDTPGRKHKKWGVYSLLARLPEYQLESLEMAAQRSLSYSTPKGFESTVFVEEGNIMIGDKNVASKKSFTLKVRSKVKILAVESSVAYVFSGPADEKSKRKPQKVNSTFDFRDKYWGSIETVVSGKYAGKRIFVREECFASLEFHCKKLERYYIHSGKLLLRLRAGRGEDRYFELQRGDLTVTPPGLMHQRGGLKDTVIIEISTKDEDSDSYLVEDGSKHKMPRLKNLIDSGSKKSGRQICFDIDGIICTQTDGDYSKAKPITRAINLINKLHDEDHTIYLFTARFMGRNQNDWKKAYEDGYALTKKQLDEWGVKYHEIFFGKPNLDIMIDDRALFFNPNWDLIEKGIRDKLGELR